MPRRSAGRANGPVINLSNHQSALSALQATGIGAAGELDGNGYSVGSPRWAQDKLTAAGFDTYGVDGVWGIKSQTALKAFEQAKGLTVDAGILGPQTIAELEKVGT